MTLASDLRASLIAHPAAQAIDGPALTAFCDAMADPIAAHANDDGFVVATVFASVAALLALCRSGNTGSSARRQ